MVVVIKWGKKSCSASVCLAMISATNGPQSPSEGSPSSYLKGAGSISVEGVKVRTAAEEGDGGGKEPTVGPCCPISTVAGGRVSPGPRGTVGICQGDLEQGAACRRHSAECRREYTCRKAAQGRGV